MIRHCATAGTHVHQAASEAASLAVDTNEPVEFDFNGSRVVVQPGDSQEVVLRKWDESRERYLIWDRRDASSDGRVFLPSHCLWFKWRSEGYTADFDKAGRYTAEEAGRIVNLRETEDFVAVRAELAELAVKRVVSSDRLADLIENQEHEGLVIRNNLERK